MTSPEDISPKPITTVDLVIFSLSEQRLDVLLLQRGTAPFDGAWALPGGWVRPGEDSDLEAAARRVLREKTGVAAPYLEQLQTVGNLLRDPRGWSVSISYMALIGADQIGLQSGSNAADVAWQAVDDAGSTGALAFDHASILAAGLARLRNKVEYSTLPVHLLPAHFTLSELQSVYERILGRRLDKSAFRKRMAEADFVEPVSGEMRRASNRPAQLYRVKQARSTRFFDRTL